MNTYTYVHGLRALVFAIVVTLAPTMLFAQGQYYHTAGIVLDDGVGNTVTLLPPGGTTGGGLISWPTANASGVLTNDGSGNLSWAAAGGGGGFTPAYLYAATLSNQTVLTNTALSFLGGTITTAGFTGTSTFTATAGGVYMIEFDVSVGSSSTSFGIQVNGVLYAPSQFYTTASSFPVVHGRTIIQLNAGDVIGLCSITSNASVTAPGGCRAALTVLRIQ